MSIKNKIHYVLGKLFGIKYRNWYYKNHNDLYLWGIINFVKDNPLTKEAVK